MQNDSQEFCRILLEDISSELNEIKIKSIYRMLSNSNEKSKILREKDFHINFSEREKSIITELFYAQKLQSQRERGKKKKHPLLCKAQHEWESCHCTVCPCSILASYNFLHNCLNVLILIPVALPTLCYFLKKDASRLCLWL